MKCNRYQKYLIPYAEGALSGKLLKSVEKHLTACESCSEELAELRQTVDVLRQTEYPAMEPAGDLRSRVMAQIAREPAPARKSWWGAYSAAATALLIFAVVMVTVQPVFFHTKQAALRHEPAVEQATPQERLLKSPSPHTRVVPSAPVADGHINPLPTPTTKAPASETKDLSVFKRSAATAPAKPAETFDHLDNKVAVPEGHPRDVAQATYGGGQQALAGPAVPPSPAQIDRAESAKDSCGVSLEKNSDAPRDLGNSVQVDDKCAEKHKISSDANILELEKKLREFPNSRTVLTELLKAYRDTGRSEDEYAIAERLTKLDADNPQYWFACAQAAERVGKTLIAEAAYRQAIQLNLSGPDLELAKGRLEVLEKN